jgi:hypothetical protein
MYKVPKSGQLAFRGNIRRAIAKNVTSTASILLWLRQHPQWPVSLLNQRQVNQLQALQSSLEAALVQRVPFPPPQA